MSQITAWFLFIIVLIMLARIELIRRVMVYALWLAVALLLVVNYQQIVNLFQPITQGKT
jgi:hypothetical protein